MHPGQKPSFAMKPKRRAAQDCLVFVDTKTRLSDRLIPTLSLPDPDDRHVLAAAIRCGANFIVTFNTKDFPKKSIESFGIEAFHPDEFVLSQVCCAPSVVCSAAKRQRVSLRNPPKNVDEYLNCLSQQGLPRASDALPKYRNLI